MLAQTVSALIINELIYEMLGLVEEGGLIDNYMRDLYKNSEIDLNFVAVLDNSFKVISHNDFSEYGKRYNTPIIQESLDNDEIAVQNMKNLDGEDNALEFAIPLSIEGKRWGFLYFSLSLELVEREIRAFIELIVVLSGIALLVLTALIYFLSRRFIKPIIDLNQAMTEVEVEMGEKKIPVIGSDELAHLTRSFNDMVSRIRNANEEMKIAHEKLLHSEKLATLGVLSSSIAHRINNPLGGLFNCVSMLRKKGEDGSFRNNYLDLIEEGLDSIKQTVSQLLSSASPRDNEERRSDINMVLSGVLKFLDYKMKRQDIHFSSNIEEGLAVNLAPHDLEEIFLNTMLNSIQAMPTGGSLHVDANRLDDSVRIAIRDSGEGISLTDLDKVFDLFYTTKKPDEGTGVGMWMTYELVKKYKGDISLKNRKTGGTTVTFILPGAE
jgi:signal transduction histidine kinase